MIIGSADIFGVLGFSIVLIQLAIHLMLVFLLAREFYISSWD